MNPPSIAAGTASPDAPQLASSHPWTTAWLRRDDSIHGRRSVTSQLQNGQPQSNYFTVICRHLWVIRKYYWLYVSIYICVCNPSLSLSVSVAKCYYISCRQVRRTSKRYASFESNLAAGPARFTWVFLSLVSTQVPFDHRKPCETAGCLTQPGAPLGSAEVLHRGLPYRRLGCRFLDHFWAI